MPSCRASAPADPPRILFVCLGNICRSPAAEGVMLDLLQRRGLTGWTIDSAGTGGWHIGDLPDPRMRAAARARGLDLTHICRQVREADFDSFDLLIGMDDANVDALRALAPTPEATLRVHSIGEWLPPGTDHVPDPYYGGASGFTYVLNLLEHACNTLADTLTQPN